MGLTQSKKKSLPIFEYYDCFSNPKETEVLLSIWLYFNNLFSLKVPEIEAQKNWDGKLGFAIRYALNWLEERPNIGEHSDSLRVTHKSVYKKLKRVAIHYNML